MSFGIAYAKRLVASIVCQSLRWMLMSLDVQPGCLPQGVSLGTGWGQTGRQ